MVTHYNSENFFLIEEAGVRLGDKLLIFPIQGRKKEVALNRRVFELLPHLRPFVARQGYQLFLPGRGFSFSLGLIPQEGKKDEDKFSRYLLQSHSALPFKVNGSVSFQAFIQRGDQVIIGPNRLDFLAPEKTLEQEEMGDSRLIRSDMEILLQGETGTGKSRLAQKIHQESERGGLFVPINLSAFSKGVMESELFGHVKGAFTGAEKNKTGAFLEANRGTLFLDEIDSLPLEVQTKLLLFLDTKKVRPVGGTGTLGLDVRLIFASGRNLQKLVESKAMRKDFYFRLTSGARLELAPLRERPSLIETLCHDMAMKEEKSFCLRLIRFYKSYSWPGNIRQLLGHLKKKVLVSPGRKIEFNALDEELIGQDFLPTEEVSRPLEEVKLAYAYRTFLKCGEDYHKSADLLKVNALTVKSMVNKYRLTTNHIV